MPLWVVQIDAFQHENGRELRKLMDGELCLAAFVNRPLSATATKLRSKSVSNIRES